MTAINTNPELEAKTKYLKGSTLDKIFDVLSTAGYAAGGVDYYRQQAVSQSDSNIERSLINAAYGVPVLGLAVGLTSKSGREAAAYGIENRLEVARVREVDSFWAGLATNIVYDPTSYVGVGAVKSAVSKVGMGGIRMLPNAAKTRALAGAAKINKLDNTIIAAKTRAINVAMKPIGKAAGVISRPVIKGTAGAARDVNKVLRNIGGKFAGVRNVFGEVFEPGYKLKKLGPDMKEFVEGWQDMVVSRRGKAAQARWEVVQLGKQYKRAGGSAMEYVERGVSTGIRDLDKYLDDVVSPYLKEMRATELAAGYDIGEAVRYAPHILTRKGEKFFGDLAGDESGILKYIKDKANIKYGEERTFTGSATEINELLGEKVFMTDLWEALAVRSQRSASDRATTAWLKDVQDKFGLREGGQVVEQTLTAAAEKIPGKLRKYESLLGTFTRAADEIAQGRPVGHFIEGAVDRAAKAGAFGGAQLKGTMASFRAKTRDMVEYSTRLHGAQQGKQMLLRDLDEAESSISLQLNKVGSPIGGASRELLVRSELRFQDVLSRMPRAEQRIVTAVENLRSQSMGLQRDIIDPLNRQISSLTQKGKETKTMRVIQEASDDAANYVDSTRSDITTKLPADMVKFLDDLGETKRDDSVLNSLDRGYSWGMTKWKKTVTLGIGPLIRTSFFGRNILTGVEQNVQEVGRIRTLRGMYDAARLASGIGTFKTLEHGKVGPAQMQRLMRESGQLSSTGMSDVDIEGRLFPTIGQKIWGVGGTLMRWSEATVREPIFLESMRKMSLADAAKRVKGAHFDYAPEALTPIERAAKKYAFPFYTFTRFNLERQTKKLFTKPESFNDWGKIQREAIRNQEMEEEFEDLKDWQRDLYLVPNPIQPGQFMSLPLPQTAVNLNPGAFYYQLNPLKQVLEIGSVMSGWGSEKYKMVRSKAIFDDLMFGSQKRQFKQLTDTDTTTKKKISTAMGLSTYDTNSEVVSFEEFEQYRYRMVQPTKQQEYQAWVEAGSPEGFRVITLGPAVGQIGTESDITIKAPFWKFWQKDEIIEAIEHDFELGIVKADVFDMGRGYPWNEATWASVNKFEGSERTAAITDLIVEWDAWKQAQYRTEPTSVQQEMDAWNRSGRPDNATARVYRGEYGRLLGIASWDQAEIEKLNKFSEQNVRLTNAAYEWAFVQSDMAPEEWILSQLDKKNAEYLAVSAAKEELRGFNVDQPIPAGEVNMTQQIEYSAYRQDRVDYEQKLIEKALGRGEVI